MKPTHPVELLVCAIGTQEGELTSHTNNNPGNLRFAHQLNATRPDGTTSGTLEDEPIAIFDSWADGICALFRDVWAKVAQKMTVRELISTYAPPNENNTTVYLADVLEWTELPPDTHIVELLPPLFKMN